MRKTHNSGRKHKDNVKYYYQKWMEEQAQSLIDQTSKKIILLFLFIFLFIKFLPNIKKQLKIKARAAVTDYSSYDGPYFICPYSLSLPLLY